MQAVIDIFVKLIIAVISFIAPVVIAALAILVDRLPALKSQLTEREAQAEKLKKETFNRVQRAIKAYQEEISSEGMEQSNDVWLQRLVKNSKQEGNKEVEKFTKPIKDLKRKLWLLNLRAQILWIFGFLLLALVSLMIFQLIYSAFHDCFCLPIEWHNWTLVATFIISVLCFYIALRRIWELAGIIIDDKISKVEIGNQPSRDAINEPSPSDDNNL